MEAVAAGLVVMGEVRIVSISSPDRRWVNARSACCA